MAPHGAVLSGGIGGRLGKSALNGIVSLATSALTIVAVGHYVSPAEYGEASVLLARFGILTVALTCCGSLVYRFGPEELAYKGAIGSTVAVRLVFSWPVLAALLIVVPLFGGSSLALTALTLLWIPVTLAWDVAQAIAVAAQRFGSLTAANTILKASPIFAIAVCTAVAWPVRGITLVGATVLGTLSATVLVLSGVAGLLREFKVDRLLLTQMWRYALPMIVGAPALAAVSWADPLLLSRFASKEELGCYQLAYPTITVFATLGASFNAVYTPELVHAEATGRRQAYQHYLERGQSELAVATGMIALGAALAGPWFLTAILPSRYGNSPLISGLLSIAGIGLLGFWSLLPIANINNKTWLLQGAIAAQAVSNIALDVGLAPRFGALGIAAANIGAWLVAYATLTLFLRPTVGLRGRALPLLLALALGGTAVLLALRRSLGFLVPIGAAAAAIGGLLMMRSLRERRTLGGLAEATDKPAVPPQRQ